MALGQKEISLKIKANTKKFQDELKKLPGVTDKEAKKMAGKFAKQFDKAERASKKSSEKMARNYKGAFGQMGTASKKFSALLGPALFAGAAVGLAKMANSASEYTDKVMLMSKQTGLTSETLIGMEFAAQAAGSSIDEMKTGLNAFVMKAGQAANIGGASAAVFERLGVSVKDAGGKLRSTEDIFRDSINAISGMDSASEKATTAAELFGAKGAKIAAVFADGTGTLDQWAEKAKEAGIVMDGPALKASADMDRAMADLKLTIRGVVQETGNDLIPAMILIAKAVGTVIKQVGSLIVGWDNLTDSMFGNIQGGGEIQKRYYAQEKAIHALRKEVENYDGVLKDAAGTTIDGATAAAVLQARIDHTGDALMRVGQGYELNEDQTKKLHLAWNEANVIAGQLGISMDDLKSDAAAARLETQRLAETELNGLAAELNNLGNGIPVEKLVQGGKKAAEALEKLNRSFELEALARVDEPLAKFEKEMDRINEALISGLDLEKGQEAKIAAEAELNESRLEAALEIEGKIQEAEQNRIEAKVKAEEAATKAAALLQQEYLQGTQDLANKFFDLAKSQRGITFQEAQALAIAQAIMNTAVGVTQELKKGVVGIPTALLIGAAGAIEIAAIRSQTMHAGGMVGGTPDERPANLLTGEAVITRAGVESLGGAAGVNSINAGASMAPIVVINQYKHRSLDVQIRDQLRSDSALTRATSSGQRMGHK